MAKIRNVFINCSNGDVKKSFEVAIIYSNKEKRFEIILPTELKQMVLNFTYEEAFKQGIRDKKIHGNYSDKLSTDYYVIGDTEALVIAEATKVFTLLNNLNVVRRSVIVIEFSEEDSRYYRDHYNQEHPKIGLKFGLLYCTETKAGSSRPNYTLTYEYEGLMGEKNKNIRCIDVSSNAVVIDDTEENRLFLENTYGLLAKLIGQLGEYCKTPYMLLQLIASKQKLLG